MISSPLRRGAGDVAVLFARNNSIYKTIPGCDVWNKERNALFYDGDQPVISHPPCRAWGKLRHHAKSDPGEKLLALFAIGMIRKNGGVLEHPYESTLWDYLELRENEYLMPVDQYFFGHRARKRTRLFIGARGHRWPPRCWPAFPLKLGEASHTVGLWSGRDRARARPSINKSEYEKTPYDFATWLVSLVRSMPR